MIFAPPEIIEERRRKAINHDKPQKLNVLAALVHAPLDG